MSVMDGYLGLSCEFSLTDINFDIHVLLCHKKRYEIVVLGSKSRYLAAGNRMIAALHFLHFVENLRMTNVYHSCSKFTPQLFREF